MFLLKAKKVFIKKMTILTLILSIVIGLIYHLFIPDRYFPWFPAIPVFYGSTVSGLQRNKVSCQCADNFYILLCGTA